MFFSCNIWDLFGYVDEKFRCFSACYGSFAFALMVYLKALYKKVDTKQIKNNIL